MGRELLSLHLSTPNILNNQPFYCPEESNGRGVVGNWAEWPRPLDIVGWLLLDIFHCDQLKIALLGLWTVGKSCSWWKRNQRVDTQGGWGDFAVVAVRNP